MPEAVTTGVNQERNPVHSLPQGCLADAGLADKTTWQGKLITLSQEQQFLWGMVQRCNATLKCQSTL